MLDIIMSCYFPEGEVGIARCGYAIATLEKLWYNLKADYHIILAHDGPENSELRQVLGYASAHMDRNAEMISGPHNGIGSSLNRALVRSQNNVWMYITDDFLLTKPLDLDKPLALINAGYDYVRLLIHPDLECRTKFAINLGWYLELKTDNGYVVATRPFLMTNAMTHELAKYNEYCGFKHEPFIANVTSYDVEIALNNAACYLRDIGNVRPFAAILSDGTEWEHIGVVEVGHLAVAH